MRRLLWTAALGLCAAGLTAVCPAHGSELGGGPATPVKVAVKPAPVKEVATPAPTCGRHGTSLEFVDTPSEAARQAKKEGKLVFVLHVSGHFEDPRFT
jgi:hypothetical protein